MSYKFFLLGILFFALSAHGQHQYAKVDSHAKSVPASMNTHTQIARYLTKNFATPTEKARAIYVWIAQNIRYDGGLFNEHRRYESVDEIVKEALALRRGTCNHYAHLFYAMGRAVGLEVYLIVGQTKNELGNVSEVGHAWNAIRIGNDFFLIDTTWAAGYVHNNRYVHKFRDHYFCIPPQDFIEHYMPLDPLWQLLDNPLTFQEFCMSDFSKLQQPGNFAFRDSVRIFNYTDKVSQLEGVNRRILASGFTGRLAKEQVDENKRQIAYAQYNLAIDTLNFAVKNYNVYVAHKNNQFRKSKVADSELESLILNAEIGVAAADKILTALPVSFGNQFDPTRKELRDRLAEITQELDRERGFLKLYFSTWRPLRILLFYAKNMVEH